MSDYTQITDFSAKDALASGNPNKLIVGSEFDAEFAAIETAVATKYDSGNLASQGEAETGTDNTVLMTPLRTEQWSATWAGENAGAVGDIQALTDPGADRILFWDDSAGEVTWLTPNTGLTVNGTDLNVAAGAVDHDSLLNFVADEHVAHSGVTLTAGVGLTGGGTIAASRTFNLDISGITAETSVEDADSIAIYDSSAGAMREMTRANFLAGVGWDTENIKASDTSITNDNTLTIDTDFTVSLDASSVYEVEYGIMLNCDTTSEDFQCQIQYTGNLPTDNAGLAVLSTISTVLSNNQLIDQSFTNTYGGGGRDTIYLRGLVPTSTAGDLTFAWSQVNSGAGFVAVEAGSFVRIRKIA
jgi:hypothetical protein